MAEGGIPDRSLIDSFSNASGDVDESFCEPCMNRGRWIAVEGYCQVCQEYLCITCLGVHENQKLTRGHQILDKKQMPGGQARNDLCVEICKRHYPEVIKFYCTDHDIPGCADCMTLGHTSCKKERIQDHSDGFQTTKEYIDIQRKLESFHKELETMGEAFDGNLHILETDFTNIQHKITTFRKRINNYFDTLQQQMTDKVSQLRKKREDDLKRLIARNEKQISEVDTILARTRNDTNVNVHSIFVNTKQIKQRLDEIELEMWEIEQLQEQQEELFYGFRPSVDIMDLLSTNNELGQLLRKPSIHTTVIERKSFNIYAKKDKNVCLITDATLMGPDRMVITDINNNNIKLIDLARDKVISNYSLSTPPCAVAKVSEHQVVVTLPEEKKLQLFDVTTTFTAQRQIQVTDCCYGVAFSDGKLAVTYNNSDRVDIMNIHGQLQQSIQPTRHGEDLLSIPYYITFGEGGDTVIVSDFSTNEVSKVSIEGQVLHTYRDDMLVRPHGVSVTEDGIMFVCFTQSGTVHAVTSDFTRSKVIIKGEEKPVIVTYCDASHTLYVITSNNLIQVFDLNI